MLFYQGLPSMWKGEFFFIWCISTDCTTHTTHSRMCMCIEWWNLALRDKQQADRLLEINRKGAQCQIATSSSQQCFLKPFKNTVSYLGHWFAYLTYTMEVDIMGKCPQQPGTEQAADFLRLKGKKKCNLSFALASGDPIEAGAAE